MRSTATWRAGVPGNVTPRLQPENVTAPTVLITTTTKKRTGTDRTLVLLLLHHHLLLLILMTKRNKARAVESVSFFIFFTVLFSEVRVISSGII